MKLTGASLKMQHRIYSQLRVLEKKGDNPEIKKERKNSKRSRAHRLDQFMVPDEVTCMERLSAVRGVLRLLERSFCTAETALEIIHNISKGE